MFSSDLSVASVMIKWKLKHLIQTFEQEYTFHIVGMRGFFLMTFFLHFTQSGSAAANVLVSIMDYYQ